MTKTSRRLLLTGGLFLFTSFFFLNAVIIPPSLPENVGWSSLSPQLTGFAKGTNGGLYGRIYEITDLRDYNTSLGEAKIPNTLRWGIEEEALKYARLWIRQGGNLLKDSLASHTIVLKKGLRITRSNITLDGRGKILNLVTKTDWSKYTPVRADNGAWTCARKDGKSVESLILIDGVQNIIITNFHFNRQLYASPFSVEREMDKECLGDMISVRGSSAGLPAHNIWINHNTFGRCGDGCLDVTRGVASGKPGRISISYNRFNNTYKTLLLGSSYDNKGAALPSNVLPYNFSLYGNYFHTTDQRTPRIVAARAHVFNNYYYNWGLYAVASTNGGRVLFEQNVLRAGAESRPVVYERMATGIFLFQNLIHPDGFPIAAKDYVGSFDALRQIEINSLGGSASIIPAGRISSSSAGNR